MAQITLNSTGVASSGSLVLQSNGTTSAVTIDTAQNAGLGVTPSAWSLGKALEVGAVGNALWYAGSTTDLRLNCNVYYNSGYKYGANGYATYYSMANGAHTWYNAASGTAGNAITFTQAMTLDASGNLGVGTTSPTSYGDSNTKLAVVSGTSGTNDLNIRWGTNAVKGILFCNDVSGAGIGIGSTTSAYLGFLTGGTERARIDTSGNLLVGTTSGFSGAKLAVNGSNTDFISAMENTSGTTPAGLRIKYTGVSGGSGGAFLYLHDTNALRCQVAGNGNVTNANNSYGSTSDIKLKENITDATPKLAQLNQVRIVNYNLIGDTQKQIGVIAQELEQVFPSMIEETPDVDEEGNNLGTTTKSVKYSVFVPMLIKAIQEQQAIIESLTARITALEAA